MATLTEADVFDFCGYTIPTDTNQKCKEVIRTLAECGCVEVIFNDDSICESSELLKFAADYGLTVYKDEYRFIICDNPVKKKI